MEYASYDNARYLPSVQGALEQGTRTLAAISGYFDISDTSQKVLEIGCASGSFLWFLKERGFAAVRGIDIDPDLVRHGREVLGVNVERADWLNFIGNDRGSYDVILALDVFEHLSPREVEAVLAKTCQRLTPRGRLIMRMPNAECPFVLATFCGDLTHKILATPGLIKHLLVKAGFLGAITFKETLPQNRWKRYIYLIMHHLLIKPIITLLHFHFYGSRPSLITRNVYCCAERTPGAK